MNKQTLRYLQNASVWTKMKLSYKLIQRGFNWMVLDILVITTALFWLFNNSVPEVIWALDSVVTFFLVADFIVFYREINRLSEK